MKKASGHSFTHQSVLYLTTWKFCMTTTMSAKWLRTSLAQAYHRPPMPNTHPRFIDTLASVVERTYNSTEQEKADYKSSSAFCCNVMT